MSDKEELFVAHIDKAVQKPAMKVYVPLISVFLPEVFILLIAFALVKFWAAILLPFHLILVMKSNENPYWVEDFVTDLYEFTLSSQRNKRSAKAVTLEPFYAENTRISDQ